MIQHPIAVHFLIRSWSIFSIYFLLDSLQNPYYSLHSLVYPKVWIKNSFSLIFRKVFHLLWQIFDLLNFFLIIVSLTFNDSILGNKVHQHIPANIFQLAEIFMFLNLIFDVVLTKKYFLCEKQRKNMIEIFSTLKIVVVLNIFWLLDELLDRPEWPILKNLMLFCVNALR